jgi:hypothetical protein
MKKTLLSAAMLCLFVLVCLAADLTGKWKGTVKTPGGDLEVTYNLKTEGEKLTGNVVSSYGELPISNGKITGDEFTFTLEFDNNSMQNKGKFYGDSIVISTEIQGNAIQTTYKRIQ